VEVHLAVAGLVLAVLALLALGGGLSVGGVVVDLDGVALGLAGILGGDGGALLQAFQESADDFFLIGFQPLDRI